MFATLETCTEAGKDTQPGGLRQPSRNPAAPDADLFRVTGVEYDGPVEWASKAPRPDGQVMARVI